MQIWQDFRRFPAKWIFGDPPPPFILDIGKHVAEIKAFEAQIGNSSTWLPPDSYMKWYKKVGPTSKSCIVFVDITQNGSLQPLLPNSIFK